MVTWKLIFTPEDILESDPPHHFVCIQTDFPEMNRQSPYLVEQSHAVKEKTPSFLAAPATFKVILTVAAIGVPLVLAYGFWIYRIFRGKVTLDDASY